MFIDFLSKERLLGLTVPAQRPGQDNWQSLRLLNVYRLFLNFALLAAFYYLGLGGTSLGERNPILFSLVNLSYLTIAAMFLACLHRKWPQFETQAYLQVYIDILAITLLMHASGGLDSGLGMLMLVAIASTALIIMDRFALLFAAIGSLAILAEQLYTHFYYSAAQTSYVQAGILGAALFATALLAMVLARRNRETEKLAQQRKAEFDDLAELNEQIIQQMESGLLFVNPVGQIRVANGSARQLLNIPHSNETPNLWAVSRSLAVALKKWLEHPSLEQVPVIDRELDVELQPHFLPMGNMGTLIRVEDNSDLKHQLQQLKLASLGRLTASIAHEIRNPLGAISHAAQLLEESDAIGEADMRLTRIMIDQSKRMNNIIEDVLQLSRRQKVEPHKINLLENLTKFASHFCVKENISINAVRVTVPADFDVYVDPNHLHQVIWNLCSNSINHSGRRDTIIDLVADHLAYSAGSYLEIRDNGTGIPVEKFEEIFEPFYTSSHEGTGLGLYIARELCDLNNARLELRASDSGACFRITFSVTPTHESPEYR